MLVLGNPRPAYDAIWSRLEAIVTACQRPPRLVLDVVLKGHQGRVRDVLADRIVEVLRHSRAMAPLLFETARRRLPPDVRDLDPSKVTFPGYRVRAYKNETQARRTAVTLPR